MARRGTYMGHNISITMITQKSFSLRPIISRCQSESPAYINKVSVPLPHSPIWVSFDNWLQIHSSPEDDVFPQCQWSLCKVSSQIALTWKKTSIWLCIVPRLINFTSAIVKPKMNWEHIACKSFYWKARDSRYHPSVNLFCWNGFTFHCFFG